MPRPHLPSEAPHSGTKAGARWCMYPLAVLFFACLVLMGYSMFWGPERLGINLEHTNTGFVVRGVEPDGPAARAGLKTGGRLGAPERMEIRQRFDWNTVGANLEVLILFFGIWVPIFSTPRPKKMLNTFIKSWGRREF